MLDLIIHKVIINTSPGVYYQFGFYKVKGQCEEKSRYVGVRGSRYWPYENNELRYHAVFTRKYLLKRLLHSGSSGSNVLVLRNDNGCFREAT
jgi:hypothetical protein